MPPLASDSLFAAVVHELGMCLKGCKQTITFVLTNIFVLTNTFVWKKRCLKVLYFLKIGYKARRMQTELFRQTFKCIYLDMHLCLDMYVCLDKHLCLDNKYDRLMAKFQTLFHPKKRNKVEELCNVLASYAL